MKVTRSGHSASDITDFDGHDPEVSSLRAGGNLAGANIIGNDFDNIITGSAGNDTIQGLGGDDVLIGGAGADVLDGGAGIDTASYQNATIGVIANLTNNANNINDAAGDIYIGIENLRGSAFGDLLVGRDDTDNVIEGGGGADIMIGGLGSDTASYEHAASGVIANLTDNSSATIGDAAGDAYGGIENLRGSAFGDLLVGFDNTNGTDGANVIEGGGGADIMIGGLGIDTLSYEHASSAVTVSLADNSINLGEAAGDRYGGFENIRGSRFADKLVGDAGDNVLEGGAGADFLVGGGGADTASYEHATVGVTVNLLNTSQNLGDAKGDQFDDIYNLRGSAFVDFLTGNGKNNVLEGGGGFFDFLDGGDAFDMASYEHAKAGVTASLSNDLLNTGDAQNDEYVSIEGLIGSQFGDKLTGDAGVNTLDGGAGNDVLEGGADADQLIGGDGIDTASYAAAFMGVTANLSAPALNTGDATGDSYDSIENLTGSAFDDTLIGTGGAFTTPNQGVNILDGGAGNDILEGGGGADQLIGGTGIDTASYASALESVVANLSAPVREFFAGDAAGDSYSSIENLTGSAFNDTLIGDGAVNTLNGGAGNDSLEGGAGADTLNGGAGSDTASYASATGAVVVDLAAGVISGSDAVGDVYSSIENLRGSAFDDTLTGDAGDNVLEGGAGADHLNGGDGIDTVSYEHSQGSVFVNLGASAGIGGNDANGDILTGIENVRGSVFIDILTGDTGNNILEGGFSGDQLDGGAGIDTASYEHATEAVTASLADRSINTNDARGDSYVSIENLTGTGLNDTLIGNAGANGLEGGAGKDTLTGGAGSDTFVFRTGFGRDTITDFTAGQDVIEMHDGLFADANAVLAAATQSGNDVLITLDAADSILLKDVALSNLHASDFHIV